MGRCALCGDPTCLIGGGLCPECAADLGDALKDETKPHTPECEANGFFIVCTCLWPSPIPLRHSQFSI